MDSIYRLRNMTSISPRQWRQIVDKCPKRHRVPVKRDLFCSWYGEHVGEFRHVNVDVITMLRNDFRFSGNHTYISPSLLQRDVVMHHLVQTLAVSGIEVLDPVESQSILRQVDSATHGYLVHWG